MYLLFGLFRVQSVSGPELAEELANESYGEDSYDGITEVQIHEQLTGWDVVTNAIVGIFFSMMTVKVEGNVQTFKGGQQ